MAASLYLSGEYLEKHPTWHVEDSSWKASHVLGAIMRNGLVPTTICEIGCGAGAILSELQNQLPESCTFTGYEFSPQAFALCAGRENESLHFSKDDGLAPDKPVVDLVLALDVMEHVDDYPQFLRSLRRHGRFAVLHVPLDLSLLSLLTGLPQRVRRSAGHLHYFTRQLVLDALAENGFEVIEARFTPPLHGAAQSHLARPPGQAPAALPCLVQRGPRSPDSRRLFPARPCKAHGGSMNLTYVIDYVFRRTPDGTVWTDTSYDETFWQPYVEIFGEVRLICRVEDVAEPLKQWRKVTGPHVDVAPLPMYRGPFGYLLVAAKIRFLLRTLLSEADAVILRVPSNLSRCAAEEMRRMKIRYAVEVVGDPHDALAPGVVRMPGRALLRSMFTDAQKRICATATAVSYVAGSLQRRYPAARNAPSLVCSDVRLGRDWLRNQPRRFKPSLRRRLLTVATLSQTYKGIDVLLRAVAQCRMQRLDISLSVVGSGKYQASLERQAQRLGIADSVTFEGVIAWGPALIDCFDAADLFVLPSRVEAMPRALLEAMARGLPAIATNVGAIHEVLSLSEMVEPGDACVLAQRIIEVCRSSRRMQAMSHLNLNRAASFSAERLQPRWRNFQQEIRATFEPMLHAKPAA